MIENAWAKTRRDHAAESAEDYVEAIFRLEQESQSVRLSDLAERFGVSAPTVSKLLSRLESRGLVHVEPRSHVELTEEGLRLAEQSLERHTVVVAFLEKIGVSPAQAELDSEGIEHHVSEETLAAMKRFLVD
ncbi:MAG: MarR family transcriptional regulator [Fimbriimonadaceae bacterium]|nr:MarR family transcriptional regulator [Fimbriimonadaceae bacterium]